MKKPGLINFNTASWFGTRNITPPEKAELETLIQNSPREAVKTFIKEKDGIGLVFILAHQNLAVRYLALQGIKNLQDKNCLPYLLRLAETTIQPVATSPETDILYANYCEQLVSVIATLTGCNFNRCPFAHYPPQLYLKLGFPSWEKRIDQLNSQGIGMYATLLISQ